MGSKGERSGFLSSSNHNFTFFSVLRKEIKFKGTVSLIPSPHSLESTFRGGNSSQVKASVLFVKNLNNRECLNRLTHTGHQSVEKAGDEKSN